MKNPYNVLTMKKIEAALRDILKKKEGKPREFIFYRIINGKIVVPGLMDQGKLLDEILANK